MRVPALLLVCCLALVSAGCGSDSQAESESEARQSAAHEAQCDPNYAGACLDPYASDYDCEGGSGDGPEYTGPVTVVGEDHYGLDSDSDGYACEY